MPTCARLIDQFDRRPVLRTATSTSSPCLIASASAFAASFSALLRLLPGRTFRAHIRLFLSQPLSFGRLQDGRIPCRVMCMRRSRLRCISTFQVLGPTSLCRLAHSEAWDLKLETAQCRCVVERMVVPFRSWFLSVFLVGLVHAFQESIRIIRIELVQHLFLGARLGACQAYCSRQS